MREASVCVGIGMRMRIQKAVILLLLLLPITTSCAIAQAATPTPTLLPYPDELDLVLVHDGVTARINEARAAQGIRPLAWDEVLQGLAEGQAWGIVEGTVSLGEMDDAVASELGEPVAELRACISDNVVIPAVVAEVAVEQWLADPALSKMLLGNWERIGVGYDWGCPDPETRGVMLVVVLAGGQALREG